VGARLGASRESRASRFETCGAVSPRATVHRIEDAQSGPTLDGSEGSFVLIVARRKGQRIRIGENIEVVVTEVSRGEVRLGIVAPKHVPVVREEMRRAVEDANRAAAASTLSDETESSEVRVVTELGVGAFSSSSAAGTRS
jgi:carbon storage regulator